MHVYIYVFVMEALAVFLLRAADIFWELCDESYHWSSAFAVDTSHNEVVLRTQTRPAIEFISGEEGLRPKFHFFVLSFLENAFHRHPEV